MSVWKSLTKILLICGSLFLVGCSKEDDYNKAENIESYNYYSYYIASNVDVEHDVIELLQINCQDDIDTYVADTVYLCRDLKAYLETKTFFPSIDVSVKNVSVDSECFKNIDKDYNEFKTIRFIVNATLYTDYDISDVLVYVTYKDRKIVKFEYIGI